MLSLHPRRAAHLSLGGNIGDRLALLKSALGALAAYDIEITRISPVYETAPMYVADQPAFLNMAVATTTAMTPEALLRATQAVERAAGRDRAKETRNGPRTLDIDILTIDGVVQTPATAAPATALILPHPRMAERAFVLAPLADIAGALTPPSWNMTIDQALDQVDGRASARRHAPPPALFEPPTRREDSYVILLREFRAVTQGGSDVAMDLDVTVLHPGRPFRDEISAVMSYEDVVIGLRRLCARADADAPSVLSERVGDLCLSFPRVISVQTNISKDHKTSRDFFTRTSR